MAPKLDTQRIPLTADLVHEQSFAAKHGLSKTLSLVVFDYALGRSEVGIVANIPLLLATEADAGDVAEHRRCE